LIEEAKPLAVVTAFQPGDDQTVTATFRSEVPIVKAELIWTTDDGDWPKREWQSAPATIDGEKAFVTLPKENLKAYGLVLTDERDLRVSSQVIIIK